MLRNAKPKAIDHLFFSDAMSGGMTMFSKILIDCMFIEKVFFRNLKMPDESCSKPDKKMLQIVN